MGHSNSKEDESKTMDGSGACEIRARWSPDDNDLQDAQDDGLEEFRVNFKAKKIDAAEAKPQKVGFVKKKAFYCKPPEEEVIKFLNEIKSSNEQANDGERRAGRKIKYDLSKQVYKNVKIKVEPFEQMPQDMFIQNGLFDVPLMKTEFKKDVTNDVMIENQEIKIPKRLGRPPKPKSAEDLLPKITRKRGRPPKPRSLEDMLAKIRRKPGRPPKPRSLEDMLPRVPKKLGRPPKPRPENFVPKIPKPRGRPPKPKRPEDLVPKIPKKRGRPFKPRTAEQLLPKYPKKRGPKPKGFSFLTDKINRAVHLLNQKGTKPKVIFFEKEAKEHQIEDEALAAGSAVNHETWLLTDRSVLEPIVLITEVNTLAPDEATPCLEVLPPTSAVVPKSLVSGPKAADDGPNPQIRKVGRPKKGFEKPKEPKGPPKKRGRKRKIELQADGTPVGSQGNVELQPPEQNIYVNSAKKLKSIMSTYKKSSHVPAYRARSLLSCPHCQQFSWDIKQCSNCWRAMSADVRTLTVEEHEVINEILDKARPFFHQPPIPYYRPGRVVFCSKCFYYSVGLEKCSECDAIIPESSQIVTIDFENQQKSRETLGAYVVRFKARYIDDKYIECPRCELSCVRYAGSCCHCSQVIPREVTIVPEKPQLSASVSWPTVEMLSSGRIKYLPQDYTPMYRVNTVTMCRWCCTWVWDLNRCTHCKRCLPSSSDLLADGPGYDYVDGKKVDRPYFSTKPLPYLRRGISVVCDSCGEYSKNLRQCDNCSKSLIHCKAVNVNIESLDYPKDCKKLPLNLRLACCTYAMCPHCGFSSADFEHCTVCFKYIPRFAIILPVTGKQDLKKQISKSLIANKPNSICQSVTLATVSDQHSEEETKKFKLPYKYVPRYSERGIAQCPSCLGWTWDMDRCSLCFAPVNEPGGKEPLMLYFKPGALNIFAMYQNRPKFAPPPVPYIRFGLLTLCQCCQCFNTGPPFCSDCGKMFDEQPQFVNIQPLVSDDIEDRSDGSQLIGLKLRTTVDGQLALCPFCGFTTDDFETCSFCKHIIPKTVLVSPQNPGDLNLDTIFNVKRNQRELLPLSVAPPAADIKNSQPLKVKDSNKLVATSPPPAGNNPVNFEALTAPDLTLSLNNGASVVAQCNTPIINTRPADIGAQEIFDFTPTINMIYNNDVHSPLYPALLAANLIKN